MISEQIKKQMHKLNMTKYRLTQLCQQPGLNGKPIASATTVQRLMAGENIGLFNLIEICKIVDMTVQVVADKMLI